MNLLIGSRALAFHDHEFAKQIKQTTDWDVITHLDLDIENFEKHSPDALLNSEFERFINENDVLFVNGHWLHVVNPTGLAIIKRSHLWRNLSFGKHITHYHKHLKKYTEFLSLEDVNLLNRRTALTEKEFPQTKIRLNVSVEEFFDDYVTKKYDHDMLHKLVAFNDVPVYTMMQKDTSRAWCEKEMWDRFTREQKLQAVAEETMVISIERFCVPSNWEFNARLAYFKSLEKVCTTLCSGWFRDFAIDNYPEIVNMFERGKFDFVKHKLENLK